MQIQSHDVQPGEEKELKSQIRELDARKANVELCADAARRIAGDGESEGAAGLLVSLQATLRHVLSHEHPGV